MVPHRRPARTRPSFFASWVFAAACWGSVADALAYHVCEIVPPPRVATCRVHFAEGEVEVKPGSLAARELESCVKLLGYLDELMLVGYADACPMDLASAAQATGTRVVTSSDTGNSLLGEKRIESVSTAVRAAYARAGVPGTITFWTENRSDGDSRGHDADDRSVELGPRIEPGCPKNPEYTYLVDGSFSMQTAWSSIAGLGFPSDSCIYLVTDLECPASLGAYRPHGNTNIVRVAADFIRKGRTRGLVVLTDIEPATARGDDASLVRKTAADRSKNMTLVVY